MEKILTFISIIFVVFGVLQIILFFKLWGLTNNVRIMKKKMCCENNHWGIRKALLKGDRELAKQLVLDSLIEELIANYHLEYVNAGPIPIIKRYEPIFQELKMHIPDEIMAIKTSQDVYNIFNIND